MIERQQREYNWQFTFLGANIDAFSEASSIGISAISTVPYDVNKSINTYNCLSSNVTRMRNSAMVGDVVENFYTDDERKDMI